MATAEVLSFLESRQGHCVHGFSAVNSTRAIGWDERSERSSDKALLETRLSAIAHTWVALCVSLKVRKIIEAFSSLGATLLAENLMS
jgi:hypothetical protein